MERNKSKKMRRLLIYLFYDKDGIVDRYVPYLLNSFKSCCEEICVVINGKLTDTSKQILEKCASKLLIRENVGFDSWAYKYALENYGFDKLKEYDEVILSNFTMFGPLYPAEKIFEKMDKVDCDFWGITTHPAVNFYMAGIKISEHIQSYFIAYRKKILNSKCFSQYWQTLKVPTNYEEAVAFHELRCTTYFRRKGYKSASFINPKKYNRKLQNKPYFAYIKKQIEEDSMPFVKRKIFSIQNDSPEWKIEGGIEDLLQTIVKNTDYDLSLIRDNIFRTYNPKFDEKQFYIKFLLLTLKQILIPWQYKHYKRKKSSLLSKYNSMKWIKNIVVLCKNNLRGVKN